MAGDSRPSALGEIARSLDFVSSSPPCGNDTFVNIWGPDLFRNRKNRNENEMAKSKVEPNIH